MVSTQFNTLFLFALSVVAGLGASAAVLDPGHGLARRATGDMQQHHRLAKRFSNTKWSFYDVGLGACGKTNVASDYIVALNAQQFGSGYPGPNCFKQIKLSYGGKSAVATIMDMCPGCPYGGLDLSRGLFTHFAIEDVGIIYGEWSFIDGSSGSGSTPTTTTKAAAVVPTTTSTKKAAPVTTTTSQKQVWVAPTTTTTSSTKKWVAPTTSTKQWVAPTTTSSTKEWVAPTTTSTKKVVAAVPTTTSSSSSAITPARISTSRVASAAASTITSKAKAAASSSSSSSSSSPSVKPNSLAAALSSSASLASSFSSIVLPSASASAGTGAGSLNTTEANIQNNIELISDLLVRLGQLITSALEKDGDGKTTSS